MDVDLFTKRYPKSFFCNSFISIQNDQRIRFKLIVSTKKKKGTTDVFVNAFRLLSFCDDFSSTGNEPIGTTGWLSFQNILLERNEFRFFFLSFPFLFFFFYFLPGPLSVGHITLISRGKKWEKKYRTKPISAAKLGKKKKKLGTRTTIQKKRTRMGGGA